MGIRQTGPVVGDWPLKLELTRPWFWGIAIFSATGEIEEGPEELGDAIAAAGAADSLFAATRWSAAVMVRHAQAVADDDEDDDAIAVATVTIRSSSAGETWLDDADFDTVLTLPEGTLTIGDAMANIAIDNLGPCIRLRMRVVELSDDLAQHVEVEISPPPAA